MVTYNISGGTNGLELGFVNGAYVNVEVRHGGAARLTTSERDHEETVRPLLNNGTDANTTEQGRSESAAAGVHKKIVQREHEGIGVLLPSAHKEYQQLQALLNPYPGSSQSVLKLKTKKIC